MTGARSTTGSRSIGGVRKHQALKGALRLEGGLMFLVCPRHVRKHRAPKGALRHGLLAVHIADVRSESTERQKVH